MTVGITGAAGSDAAASGPTVTPKIRIHGLRKPFGANGVLAGVDIYPGESLAPLGASGSGKTLLVKCILGVVEPDAGSMELDRHDDPALRARERSDAAPGGARFPR